MVRVKNSCPPGVLCLTPGIGIFITVLVSFLVGALFYFMKTSPEPRTQASSVQQPIQVNNTVEGGDDRYTRAPLPLRFWNVSPDLRGALLPPGAFAINQSTQGLPESYQSMDAERQAKRIGISIIRERIHTILSPFRSVIKGVIAKMILAAMNFLMERI